jgi:hypothetical protein
MSRLRIIRDGAYSWLDEGPSNGANGPARFRGGPIEPGMGPHDRDRANEYQRKYKRKVRAERREEAA